MSAAGLVIRVNQGEVFLKGKFLGYRDPSVLKHKVAEIEGVITIEIGAALTCSACLSGAFFYLTGAGTGSRDATDSISSFEGASGLCPMTSVPKERPERKAVVVVNSWYRIIFSKAV